MTGLKTPPQLGTMQGAPLTPLQADLASLLADILMADVQPERLYSQGEPTVESTTHWKGTVPSMPVAGDNRGTLTARASHQNSPQELKGGRGAFESIVEPCREIQPDFLKPGKVSGGL